MARKIIENAAALGLLQIVNLALPLLALPYLAHVLGQDDLGRMAFALSVAQIFVILTDYGFTLSGPKNIALHRDDIDAVAGIWSAITCIRVAFSIAGFGLLWLLALCFERFARDLPILIAAYGMVVGNILYPQWLFQGLERLKAVSAIQVAARLIAFGALFVVVKGPDDLYLATFLQGSGFLIGGLLALPRTLSALRGGRITWPTGAQLRHQLHEGWHVFLSTAAINIYTSSNAFFLGLLAPAAVVGQFHVAERIIRAVQMLYAPIGNALYPHASRLAAQAPEQLLAFNRKLLIFLGGAAAAVSIAIFLLAPFVVGMLFGPDYALSIQVLRILSPLPFIVVCSNIFGTQTMIPLGMSKIFSRILLISAIFNLVVFIPLAYYYGAIGAAMANIAVEIGVTLAMVAALRATGRGPFSGKVRIW
ncbi:flippase [Sphingomonas sp. VNH70]|uniref:flippase n=1 Tax=Sphingomonas silueang TaxID=3156617 RepID=UPI0032B3EFBE